jgi:uncharacterized protein YndB with AHSA1/START domain
MTPPSLRIVRRLPARPEEVFDAWIDAESLRVWMCPGEMRVVAVDVDARVGGRFRIVMRGAQGDVEHTGQYCDVRRPERLVFTWMSRITAERETLVTIELRAQGKGTELTLTHEQFPDDEARRLHQGGWTSIVEKLTGHLTQT